MKIRDSFFVISDSSDLSKVNNSFFGFQLKRKEEVITGHWVEVKHKLKYIEISVDPFGMGRVFVYRNGNRWAISNSFYGLYEYINENRLNRTLNQDYINLFIKSNPITTVAYKDTIFNEIELIPSNIEIRIDKINKEINYLETKEPDFIDIDTPEFYNFIDVWTEKWINIIQFLDEKKYFVNAQLSGGFDSRLTFSLLLRSSLNFDNINIESSTRMKEDLSIASQIAKDLKFSLNSKKLSKNKSTRLDGPNSLLLNYIHRLGFHKQFLPSLHYRIYSEPVFHFTGYGNMRGWFNDDSSTYIQFLFKKNMERIKESGLQDSFYKILNESYSAVERRTQNQIKQGKNFLNYVYNFTRGRSNYGSSVMASASTNQYILAPILDLQRIRPTSDKNDDFNLLFAYIYLKNCPSLLNYKFNSNRKIGDACIKRAMDMLEKHKSMPLSNWSDEIYLRINESIRHTANNRCSDIARMHEILKLIIGDDLNLNIIESETSSYFVDDLINDLNSNNEIKAFGALSLLTYKEFKK